MPEVGPFPRRQQTFNARLAVPLITFRVRDAACYIGISPTALWRLLHDGVLPRVTIGKGCTVVPRLVLDTLIASEAPDRTLGRKKQP